MSEALYELRYRAIRLWLVIKHRSFFRCPFCEGKGGAMSGYYEPEWSECHACHRHWDDLVDHGLGWVEGRLPLLEWLRAKVAIRCGIGFICRFREAAACKLGWHYWMDEDDIEPGLKICCVCYEDNSSDIAP